MCFSLMLIAACCTQLAGEEGHTWTIEELAKGLKARDEALRTYAFDAQYAIKTRSDLTGKILEHVASDHIEYDRPTGRFFQRSVKQDYMPPMARVKKDQEWFLTREELIAYDGDRTRAMSWSQGFEPESDRETNTKVLQGHLYRGRKPAWIINPEDFVGELTGYKLGDHILSKPFRIVSSTEPNIVSLECDFGPPKQGSSDTQYWTRIWLDMSKNMALVRTELSAKPATSSKRLTYLREYPEDWVQIDGFWMPSLFHYEHFTIPITTDYHLVREVTAKVSNWSLNKQIPLSRYRIAFESGTLVNDSERGVVYRAGEISDHTVARDAEKAALLRARFEQAKASLPAFTKDDFGPGRRWFIRLGIIFLVILLAFVARRSINRQLQDRRRVPRGLEQ